MCAFYFIKNMSLTLRAVRENEGKRKGEITTFKHIHMHSHKCMHRRADTCVQTHPHPQPHTQKEK